MKVKIIIMEQNNPIKRICSITEECSRNYKNLNIQERLVGLNYIMYLISFVEKEDIKILNKKDAQLYKDTVEWVWSKLDEITYNIINHNVKCCDDKINKEEDLSKLSKEELIARLKEATK